MKFTTLADLYLDQLQDMHSCERQIIRALPKMAKAAELPELREAFTHHLAETRTQVERLDRILADLGKTAGRKVCKGTAGIVEEGAEVLEAEMEPGVRNAGLICAAQKLEHYEIASYGCLVAFAMLLGRARDAKLLETTLNEEKTADELLTKLALGTVNAVAAA